MGANWNPGQNFVQGYSVGGNVANQAFANGLRMQQLRSEQAARRVREENAAKLLSLKIQENDLAIQERADMAKAISAAQDASAPEIMVPMQNQEGLGEMSPPVMPVPNPNPMTREQAAMRFVLPVVAKYRPDQVPNFLEGVALGEARQRAGESLAAQRESSQRLNEARIKQVNARTEEIIKGRPNAQPEWVESIQFLEERMGRKLAPEVIENIYNIKSGLKPRAGTQRVPSEGEFVSRHIEKVMEQNIIREEDVVDSFFGSPKTTVKYRRPKTLKEGEQVLKEQYQRLFSPNAAAPDEDAVQPTSGDEVIRIVEGGRRAVFNSRTKQFIRYAD